MTLQEEWDMTYDEYVQYLLDKYGGALDNYFRTKECRSKNPNISRTMEGLECHHIDENKYIHLSTPEFARQHWESQKYDRLVYADKIEHLLLHIKITLENCPQYNPNADPDTERADCGFDSGCTCIIGTINQWFEFPPEIDWKADMFNKIKDRFDDYCTILALLKINYDVPDEILYCWGAAILDPRKKPYHPYKVIDAVKSIISLQEAV